MGLMKIMIAYPEDKLAFVPVKIGWTAGRIMLHISCAANCWLHSGVISDVAVYAEGESTLENYPTLKDIKTYLMEEPSGRWRF